MRGGFEKVVRVVARGGGVERDGGAWLARIFGVVAIGAVVAVGAACGARATAPGGAKGVPAVGATLPRAAVEGGAAAGPGQLEVKLRLRPEPGAPARVHVALDAAGREVGVLRLARGAAATLTALTATDDDGAIATKAVDAAGGVDVALARASRGELRVEYDVSALTDARAVTGALVVADDRFRGMGEALVLLPVGFEDARATVTVTIDGAALRAPHAASSFGVGATVTRAAPGRALVQSAYLAGSLGAASFVEALDVDHAAWLGYTAFDPRPAAAELAQIRTALREQWKGGGEEAFGLLIVSTPRPSGAYSIVPRAGSLLLHLGPGEAWSPALRVNLTQHLVHAWLGGELRLAPADGAGEAAVAWMHDGVARHVGARLLQQMGLLKPGDAQDYLTGLLAAQATAPLRGKAHAELTLLARTDATARALMVARGALWAARTDAKLRARSGGARSLESAVLLPLLTAARDARSRRLSLEALDGALTRELGPDGPKDREALFAGADVTLEAGALGPCFRLRAGPYVGFDLGFDLPATLDEPERSVKGLAASGPAAAAGLSSGDRVEDATYRDGHAEVPVKLTVLRGDKKLELGYLPQGPRRPGQVVERTRGVADAACGDVL